MPSVSAQSYGGIVIGALTCDAPNTSCRSEIGVQFTVTTEDGTFVGSCTVEGDPNDLSHVAACFVTFPFEISGSVIVTEDVDTVTPGYAPEENPIFWSPPDTVTRPSHDVVFQNWPVTSGIVATQTSDIAIVTTENGASVTDACYVLTSYSNIGCDDNGDGKITFRDVPLGTYTVHQTADLGPGRSVSDFTITVTGAASSDGWERFGATVNSTGSSSSSSSASGSSGRRQTAQEAANGGLWQLGITAHTDGADYPGYTFNARFTVTSEDGEYVGECTLEPTDRDVPWWNCKVDVPSDRISLVWEDLDSIPAGYAPVENPIAFDPTTYEIGPHNIGANFTNVPINGSIVETSNVFIVTTENGQPVYDACYVLVNFSNVGCDDNGDGQVRFADVPLGTYTVHQTADLGAGRYVNDLTINVTGIHGPYPGVDFFSVEVNNTGSLLGSGTRDIALITRDPDDGHLLFHGCYILLEYGNEGCDENGDGQITYADVPFGVYTVHQTRTPSGYPTVSDFQITVTNEYPQVPLGYVVRQATAQNAPSSRNVSVVFVDSRTHTKVESSICVKFTGGSELACDDALVDGQIDFLDVPSGTYPIEFTGIPAGWQLVTSGTAGPSVAVNTNSDDPSNQFVFVEVVIPDSAISTSNNLPGGVASDGSVDVTEWTWTATIQVNLCDAMPDGSNEPNCQGGAGVVVRIVRPAGGTLGSCTTGDPMITAWGEEASTCSIGGLPFDEVLIATQDTFTLPAGYTTIRNTLTFSSESVPPGGGDKATVTFFNVPTGAPAGTSSESATLLMTFRGCPEGFDPYAHDFFANCTIPLDAPDASFLFWGAEGQGGMNIALFDRQYDGAYIYNAFPLTMNVELSGLAPVLRDAYTVIGADGEYAGNYTVNLVDGEIREVFIFYYYL
ncbi:MAG: prealbumin-like fold domain-containing protein [Thermomicrobiales bacterium]|nr:prealbumin-like fold domain-containing protein [Thermomicrobiales bacterium]